MAKTPEEEKQDFEAKVTAKKIVEAEISVKMAKKNKTLDEVDELLRLLITHLGIT